jgi:hypothetical protein
MGGGGGVSGGGVATVVQSGTTSVLPRVFVAGAEIDGLAACVTVAGTPANIVAVGCVSGAWAATAAFGKAAISVGAAGTGSVAVDAAGASATLGAGPPNSAAPGVCPLTALVDTDAAASKARKRSPGFSGVADPLRTGAALPVAGAVADDAADAFGNDAGAVVGMAVLRLITGDACGGMACSGCDGYCLQGSEAGCKRRAMCRAAAALGAVPTERSRWRADPLDPAG